jgi:hypothetical protein
LSTLLDRPIAVAARFHASLHRRARWAPAALVTGLIVLSLIPPLIVGSTRQPVLVSFVDLQAKRIPYSTTWLRLEGDLRAAPGEPPYTYTLHDPQDDALAVTVVSASPLATGPTQVTGVVSGAPIADTFASIKADVPTEPARHDPWLLFSIPALLAIPILVGALAGYPVVRGEPRRRDGNRPVPFRPGEPISARWSGWVGNERVDLEEMRRCSLQIEGDRDVLHISLADAGAVRYAAIRRDSQKRRIRLCRTDGCDPAVELHGQGADLVLVFADGATRDRFVTTIG